jgi:serine/threonine-protein kinase
MIIDRNLLFAVLALQGDFLNQQQFLEICREWASRKQVPLGELLVQCGWLTPADRTAVDLLVEKKLHKHCDDERASLLAQTDEWVRQSLLGLADVGITHVLSAGGAAAAPARLLPAPAAKPQFGGRGRYTLTRLQASGGLGHVWLAHDPELERDVALKEIRPEHGESAMTCTRFLGEARITGRLEHPGIVPVYELARDVSGRPFYTMRFIQGRTLTAAIEEYHQLQQTSQLPQNQGNPRQAHLVFRELLQRFISVCQTISYAHSKGILHRDLKPDNVMLGEFGETLVVDWGLAKPYTGHGIKSSGSEVGARRLPANPFESGSSSQSPSSLTQEGNIIGTPMYMAPEQTIGDPHLLGPWTDIHALGILLYILLTGKPPYSGDVVDVMLQIRDRLPVPPSHLHRTVPRALEAVCLKALAKNPADRYGSATELAAEIQHWLADEPVQACREPLGTRLRRWVKRHRALVTGAAATVIVGVVALLVSTVFLTVANQRERVAKQEAEQQRDRADKNLDLARKAVDDTLAHIAAHPRLRQPDLLSLRRDLLAQVVPFYKQFVEQRADDPRVEADHGNAYGQLALVHHELGQTDLAITELRQKQAIYRTLTARHPHEWKYHQELASSLNNLSILLRTAGRREEAGNMLRECIHLQQSLPPPVQARDLLAACHVSLGNLLHENGDLEGAVAALEEARRLFQAVVSTSPGNVKNRQGLAACENNLGILLSGLERPLEADTVLQHAVQLREELAAERPEPGTRLDLARTYSSLGTHWSKQDSRLQEAEALYRKAIALLEPITRTPPVLPEYRRELALLRIHLGTLLQDLGQPQEAAAALQEAVVLLEKLRQEVPLVLTYGMDLGSAYGRLGNLVTASGQPEAALGHYAKAIAVLEACRKQDQNQAQVRLLLCTTHWHRAEALTILGRHSEALTDWDRAIAMSSSGAELYHLHHAASVARSGRIQEALDTAERFAAGATSGPLLVALARLHAIAAAGLPDPTQRERHAVQALELLEQAQQAKAFQDRWYRELLRTGKDFEPLRNKAEFRKLLDAVAGKGQ